MTTGGDSRDRPAGAGRRRSRWFDPRFFVGVLLVVCSVLGVVGLVGAANASVDVLAARSALTPGERVRASDLVPTSVRADRTADLYLRASEVPSAGVVVTRPITPGELVPRSAVGSEAGIDLVSVVIAVNSPLAASVASGARVDLWSATASTPSDADVGNAGGSGSFAPPTVLVSSAIVVRLVDSKSLVDTDGSSVELLVPKQKIAGVLDAIDNGAILSVVPVDLPLGQ